MQLVFMVEERSMAELLAIILPKFLPPEITFRIIPHDGKSDLKASIPRKLKSWRTPDTKFVIVQDQDSWNCVELKKELQALCNEHRDGVLVRIACVELEAWYFGDLEALAEAYNNPKLKRLGEKRNFRIADKIQNPKDELRKILPEHQQISGARRIGPCMDIDKNTSESFQCFISGVKRLVQE